MFNFSKKTLIGISLILSFGISTILTNVLKTPYSLNWENLIAIRESIDSLKNDFKQLNFLSSNSLSNNELFKKVNFLLTEKKNLRIDNNFNDKITSQKTTLTPHQKNTSFINHFTPTQNPTPTINQTVNNTPTPRSTRTPTPTIKQIVNNTPTPKPTKKPKTTPTPTFFLTNPRPGKNIREIAEIVGPIFCVPPAMVYAIYDNEAGYLGPKVESNWTFYNTYHGSDPTDIANSTALFGVTQMMGDTWHRIKPYVAKKLGTDQLSLNVTFDSMAAAAFHVGNISLAWKNKISCNDWPVDYILYGACRYNGACPANTFGQKQYYNSYTYSVCESYNEYGGKQKNCH